MWCTNRQMVLLRGECEITQTLNPIVWIIWLKKYWNFAHKIRNIQRASKIIINGDLLDKMLRLFYCLLFPVTGSQKKMEIWVGGGYLELGNLDGRGFLWSGKSSQRGGGGAVSKMLIIFRWGWWVFSGLTQCPKCHGFFCCRKSFNTFVDGNNWTVLWLVGHSNFYGSTSCTLELKIKFLGYFRKKDEVYK